MLAIDSTTLTCTLQIMGRHGWIQDRRGKDRRERLLRLANAGQRKLDWALPQWENLQARLRHARGKLYSTPVTLVEEGMNRWLVAPYGDVSWGRNARAAGRVTLSRGRRSETMAIVELGPAEAAPILKQYIADVPITRPFFDVTPDAPLEAFVAEARRHPVFRIDGASR
jgi:hypothetical protein